MTTETQTTEQDTQQKRPPQSGTLEVLTAQHPSVQNPSEALPGWDFSVSPLAVFQANRIESCTDFQLSEKDRGHTKSFAHVETATRHLRAAFDELTTDDEDSKRFLREIYQSNSELVRLANAFGVLMRH